MSNDNLSVERKLQEALEIVELQEKLDMTFDPLGFCDPEAPPVEQPPAPNTNCNNTQCC